MPREALAYPSSSGVGEKRNARELLNLAKPLSPWVNIHFEG